MAIMKQTPEQAIDDCSNCGNHQQGHFNREPCKSCLDHVNAAFEENTLVFYINWTPRPKKRIEVTENSKPSLWDIRRDRLYANEISDKQLTDINHPAHYHRGGIECIDYLQAKLTPEEFIGYLKGNCMKYLSRMGYKDSAAKDAGKAAWYANRLQKEIE